MDFNFSTAMLASRGFATLALAVFNYEDLPKEGKEIHLDYFEEAIHFLLSQPNVIPDRCGSVVNSKSGDIGMYMAILFEEMKAMVGINAVTFPVNTKYYYRGKPYSEGINLSQEILKRGKGGSSYADFSPLFSKTQMIPVETAGHDTHFQLVFGDDDPFGLKACIKPFTERMQRNNNNNFEIFLYKDAGHMIQQPYDAMVPHALHQAKLPGWSTRQDIQLQWGGKPKGTCEAQVHLWQRMQDFFRKNIQDESAWFQNQLTNSNELIMNMT